jgi:hypothetical protein
VGKRGRPKTFGEKLGWMFVRGGLALCGFDKARRNGAKYEAAISEAIPAVHSWFEEMPISRTEIKRILAARQSDIPGQTLLFTEEPPENAEQATANPAALPESGTKRLRRLTFGFGPCPDHPRINASADEK